MTYFDYFLKYHSMQMPRENYCSKICTRALSNVPVSEMRGKDTLLSSLVSQTGNTIS